MNTKYIELKGPSLFSSEHWLKCAEHDIPFPKGAECPACSSHKSNPDAYNKLTRESENKKIVEDQTNEDLSECDSGFQTHDYEGDIGMKCNFCGHPLEKVGAEISAPPSKRLVEILDLPEDTEVCRRFRMCESCYNDVIVKNLVKEK